MAYSPRLQSKADLKGYILRRLGSPVIEIEITDDQLDDAIDDTLEMYIQRAYAGVTERFVLIPLLKGVSTYVLPYDVFAVLEVMNQGMMGISNNNPSNIFSINQFIAADLYRGTGRIDILTYELTNQMLATIDLIFTNKTTYDFNSISKELYIFAAPQYDQMAMLHCYKKNAPISVANPSYGQVGEPAEVEQTNIYSELWIRGMAVEKARYQWSSNLLKYSGSQLPNGLNIDVPSMLNEAKENILKFETTLADYELPVDMMIG